MCVVGYYGGENTNCIPKGTFWLKLLSLFINNS